MSPILFFAPFLGILCSLVVLVAVRALARRHGVKSHSKVIGCSIQLLVFLVCTTLFFVWLPKITTHSGLGVSAQSANDRLLTFDIPTTATNVDFHTSYFAGLIDAAEFDISEHDFLEWMTENNRKPTAFSTIAGRIEWATGAEHFERDPPCITPVSAMLDGRKDEIQIEDGFYFDDYDRHGDDSGLTIIYDSINKRAYVHRTTY